MSYVRIKAGVSCALAAIFMLLVTGVALAQGMVTPSFGAGQLTLAGEGYRPGERVELMVTAAGATHQFIVTADARGCFRLDTGVAIPPLSSIDIEARDEQGQTQATITSAPGGLPGPPGGEEEPTDSQQDVEPDATGCAP